jgi:hypothetical protein
VALWRRIAESSRLSPSRKESALDIRVVAGDVTSFAGDGLVVNLFEGVGAPAKGVRRGRVRVARPLGGATGAVDVALGGAITRLIQAGEATGKWGEQTLVHSLGRLPVERILVMGLGKREEFTLDRVRVVAAEAARAPQNRRAPHRHDRAQGSAGGSTPAIRAGAGRGRCSASTVSRSTGRITTPPRRSSVSPSSSGIPSDCAP